MYQVVSYGKKGETLSAVMSWGDALKKWERLNANPKSRKRYAIRPIDQTK